MITTKKEFEKQFREHSVPLLREQEKQYMKRGEVDTLLRRETWNNEIDGLVKDGQLPKKALTWDPPW